MYIIGHTENIDRGTPSLGTITELELMEEDGEGLNLLIEHMEENQECPETFTAIDDVSELEIELETSNYLNNAQIDELNEMFMADNEWTEDQLKYTIEKLATS